MSTCPDIIINQMQVRKEYETFLSRWDWELHITLSYFRRVDSGYVFKDAKLLLKEVRRRIRNVRFAGVLIYSNYNIDHPHVHILLTSDKSYPKSLADLDLVNLSKEFRKESLDWIECYFNQWKSDEATCKVTKGWSNETICKYISKSKNITVWDADRWEFECYRPNLLMKLVRCES